MQLSHVLSVLWLILYAIVFSYFRPMFFGVFFVFVFVFFSCYVLSVPMQDGLVSKVTYNVLIVGR